MSYIILLQLTPYLGMTLEGKVMYTVVRGNIVFQKGKFSPPVGKLTYPATSEL